MPAGGIRAQGNELLSITLWVTPQLHLLLLWSGTSSPGEEVHGRQQAGEGSQGYGHESKAAPDGTGSWVQATKTSALLVNFGRCVIRAECLKELKSEAQRLCHEKSQNREILGSKP